MTTEGKIYWGVGILSIILLLGTFFVPANREDQDALPWRIEHPTPDTIRVFGLTIGVSTPAEAESRFKEIAEPSLFRSPAGIMDAEFFFEQVNLGGLRAKVVLTVTVSDTDLREMYDRGLRISATTNGKKVTLTPDDVARLRNLPFSSLTYMPGIRIDDALVLKRFGMPELRVKETRSGAIHWLYPKNGLDITLGGAEKPVLQYVSPKEFNRLVEPLLANGEVITNGS